mmetsp:Transcript_80904/g.251160  ORF Transcript_80904/g.251160 Transcript_80904/m.251160 type:complete len:316 (+) Transcript_80904:257-1204(+)
MASSLDTCTAPAGNTCAEEWCDRQVSKMLPCNGAEEVSSYLCEDTIDMEQDDLNDGPEGCMPAGVGGGKQGAGIFFTPQTGAPWDGAKQAPCGPPACPATKDARDDKVLEAACWHPAKPAATKDPRDGTSTPCEPCPEHCQPAQGASIGPGGCASSVAGSAMYLQEEACDCERGSGHDPLHHGEAPAAAGGACNATMAHGANPKGAAVLEAAMAVPISASSGRGDATSSTKTWETSREDGAETALLDRTAQEPPQQSATPRGRMQQRQETSAPSNRPSACSGQAPPRRPPPRRPFLLPAPELRPSGALEGEAVDV